MRFLRRKARQTAAVAKAPPVEKSIYHSNRYTVRNVRHFKKISHRLTIVQVIQAFLAGKKKLRSNTSRGGSMEEL